jgi:type IV pilus assembly protein PilY1
MKSRILLSLLFCLPIQALAVNVAQSPLFITAATEPRVMLVMSRDHELSKKAYNDYTDLDGDGTLDTTYNDGIGYYGYFDSHKCYTYSVANTRFEPAAAAVGANGHHCSGQWSGNFLNWASMTRMDVVRKTLYGGHRSTDTADTVLERQFLPVDVHAFAKIYNPGSAVTLGLYVPAALVGANTAISLCNVSDSTDTDKTGLAAFTMPAPLIKVAAGSWPQWDASEVTQCGVNIGLTTQPAAALGTYTARVKVCDATGGVETNCKTYTHPTTGVQTVKPTGLLQQYGDVDAARRTRFGLMTGSYAANKSGGVLRKNVGLIANNGNLALSGAGVCGDNHDNDEIDVCTGQFINQAANQAGIINTLNRLHIAGFKYTAAGRNDKHQYTCNNFGILSFNNGECVDWGNPLGETYLEALRYFANSGATAAFNVSDAAILASIPQVAWTDPLPAAQWCALSSIIVLSTGLNSFDTDQLASFTPAGGSEINATTLTNQVGDASHENINGGSYLIGDNGVTANNQCTAKTVANLAGAKGICPEIPSMAGGYGLSGLAYAPKSIDLRPAYAAQRAARWSGTHPDWAERQPVDTYAVKLAENLPRFSPTVGAGTVNLLPACQAIDDDVTPAWPAVDAGETWRNCSMTNLVVEPNVAMASVGSDATAKTNTCSGTGTSSQCFTVAWEDSTWGNDYDMDGIQRLGYCVGGACASFKMLCPTNASANATVGPFAAAADQIVVATCAVQAAAGNALTFGYTLTGTGVTDGAYFPILRPGNQNFSVGGTLPATVTAGGQFAPSPFTQASIPATLLKNPLWYAAKYGGFSDSNDNQTPDLVSEWDAKNNATGADGADGEPDNYFDVRNPAQLHERLGSVMERATVPESSASSVATNSTRLNAETVVFQAKFNSLDWSGQVVAYQLDDTGTLANLPTWDTDSTVTTANRTALAGAGKIKTFKPGVGEIAFSYGNLSAKQKCFLDYLDNTTSPCAAMADADAVFTAGDGLGGDRVTWLQGQTVAGMRTRAKVLGDVVNSDPVFVLAEDFGYIKFGGGFAQGTGASYLTYLTAKALHTPMLYIGANDGMLHAFNANTGAEKFVYLPNANFPALAKLTATGYAHQYYVDGTVGIGDACLAASPCTAWGTYLVGSLGAGGRAIFALNITDPENITVMWEKNYTDTDFADLGNNIGPPQIVLAQTAAGVRWVAIFGNGYNGASDRGHLFIVDLADGTLLAKLDTDASAANGLGQPAIHDADASRIIGDSPTDSIYAGDMLGRIWKFRFSGGGWGLAYGVAPLFTARSGAGAVQPITAPLEIGRPTAGLNGVMLYFGTGRYLGLGDPTDLTVQSLYGIWDEGTNPISTTNRSELQQQSILKTITAAPTQSGANSGKNIRVVSNNAFTYSLTGTVRKGWYLDLIPETNVAEGERVVSTPLLRHGRAIFTTLIPSADVCSYGGTSWLMEMNALTGARLDYSVFNLNADTLFDSGDYVNLGDAGTPQWVPATGIQYTSGFVKSPAVISAGAVEYKVTSSTSSQISVLAEKGDTGQPRTSWREILGY